MEFIGLGNRGYALEAQRVREGRRGVALAYALDHTAGKRQWAIPRLYAIWKNWSTELLKDD